MHNNKQNDQIKFFSIEKKKEETKPKLNRDEINDDDSIIVRMDTLLELIYTKYLGIKERESKYEFLRHWFSDNLRLNIDVNELMYHMKSFEDFKKNISQQVDRNTINRINENTDDLEEIFNRYRRERGYLRNEEIRVTRNIDYDETDFGDDTTINEEDIIHYDDDGNPID